MMKKIMTLLFVIAFTPIVWTQEVSILTIEATDENKVLIDEIIELTKIKEQYTQMCTYFIERTAKEKGWDSKEIERRKQKMDIDNFIEMNFYDALAIFSSKELKEIISFLKKVNQKTPYSSFFLSDLTIENNLFNHILYLIKE